MRRKARKIRVPRKRIVILPMRVPNQSGSGIFDDIGDGFKKVVKNVRKGLKTVDKAITSGKVGKFIKNNKVISRGATLVGLSGIPYISQGAKVIAPAASMLGYGRRQRRRVHRTPGMRF